MGKVAKLKPVEDPEPTGEGHNLIGVDREAYDKFSALHSRDTAAVKLAQAQRNKTRKAMRAAGIILGVFDRAEKLSEMSREERQAELLHTEAYLRYNRTPMGTQFSLDIGTGDAFDGDDEGAEARIIEDAKGAGYRAGRAGIVFEDGNPYEANSEQGQAWIGAYRDGQKKNVMALGGDDAAASS